MRSQSMKIPNPYLGGLVLRTTSSITDVPVNHKKRTNGASGYTMGKLIFTLDERIYQFFH